MKQQSKPLMNPTGTGVALVTPFLSDYSVDYESLGRLVDFQIANGADYLVVLATTSEATTLDCDERREVARFVRARAGGRVPLVLGMSNNSTHALVSHIPEVDFEGYSAILSVVPYYNKPSQEGIYRHFKAVAEVSPLPVILYNVPSRTGRNMEATTTLRLANEFPGKITGIKEASGDLGQIAEIISGKPEGFHVISGDDALTLRMIRMGASGVISVIANALPGEFSRMTSLALANMADSEADRIDARLQPLCHSLMVECNPSGVKCLLEVMGKCNGTVRLPLVEVSPETRHAIKAQYESL